MRSRLTATPKAFQTKIDERMKGACQECGKLVNLRNSDGMISSHQRASTARKCPGGGLTPSKACEAVYDPEWKPARRSN